MIDSETEISAQEKCTRLSVQNAKKNVKFLSSLRPEKMYSAKNAILKCQDLTGSKPSFEGFIF